MEHILITEEQIQQAVRKVGAWIDENYQGKPVLLVSILNGAFMFMADLCREVHLPCEIGFMAVKSYFDGTESSGKVHVLMDLQQDIANYHVIIIEDIIDSGRTLLEITEMLRKRNPMSLKVLTLLDKKTRREVDFNADMSLFDIPDLFVVGYGMDYAEKYRNLPYIAELSLDD